MHPEGGSTNPKPNTIIHLWSGMYAQSEFNSYQNGHIINSHRPVLPHGRWKLYKCVLNPLGDSEDTFTYKLGRTTEK